MANSFSSALVLTDLNDFINPSQACIKPVETFKKPPSSLDAKNEIRIDDTGDYYEINSHTGLNNKLEKATITLNDCLACSGCITSAETVLITLQSQDELYNILEQNKAYRDSNGSVGSHRTIVISLSPQSRASFASKYNVTLIEAHAKLAWFFRQYLGVDYLFDTSFSRDFSLLESAREFVSRYRHKNGSNNEAMLPMLASACPGWICYAEKTHSYMLPYISTTKSPQQVMGSLVKDWLASYINQSPSSIYHVSIMPCYDKKLEASRSDFYNDIYSTRDVDCVLVTGEVEKMLSNHGLTFQSLNTMIIEPNWTKSRMIQAGLPVLLGSEGTSAGGYLSYLFRYAAHELFGVNLTPQDVQMGNESLGVILKQGRNNDFWEVFLLNPQDSNGPPLLKFAAAYGFRNIQNLIRKIKPKNSGIDGIDNTPVQAARARRAARQSAESDHHFIEVMACPSGCINGGGQLRPSNINSGAGKEWVMRAESVYKFSVGDVQSAEANEEIWRLYREWLGGEDTEKARTMLHTTYHAIEKFEANPLAVKW